MCWVLTHKFPHLLLTSALQRNHYYSIFQARKLRVNACLARGRARICTQVVLTLRSKLFLSFFFLFPLMIAEFYAHRESKPSEGIIPFPFNWFFLIANIPSHFKACQGRAAMGSTYMPALFDLFFLRKLERHGSIQLPSWALSFATT